MIYCSSSNTIKEYSTAGGAFMFFRKVLATVMTAGLMLSFVPSTALAATTGWQGDSASGWRYYTSESEYIKNDWKSVGGKWYYFDASGYMVTGWVKVGSQWYYMDKNGAMKTGWLKDGTAWYYLKSNGAALQNAWEFIGGKLYHFNSSGAMETNKWIDCGESTWSTDAKNYTAKDGGVWYFAGGENGILMNVTDYLIGDRFYDFDENGACLNPYDGKTVTGWYKDSYHKSGRYDEKGGNWYYFDADGNKICDVSDYIIDGKGYNFDTHGICKNYRNPCIHDNELDIDN